MNKDTVRESNYYGVEPGIAERHIESLEGHIKNVQEAGSKFLNIKDELLVFHDQSKWFPEEFVGYANHFQGGGSPVEFSKAWLHHIHSNPHHWQHWIFSDGFTSKDSGVVNGMIEMPTDSALEMIADWLGASKSYTGGWDMTDWLTKNVPRIRLHPKTAEYVGEELNRLGYGLGVKEIPHLNNPHLTVSQK